VVRRGAGRRQLSQGSLKGLLARAGTTLRRIPRAAWICALVACLNAACWSIVTPPFQSPDEPAHFAYTQQLAESLKLPTSSERSFSPEEEAVLRDIRQYEVHGSPENHTISSAGEQRRLQEDLDKHLSRRGGGGVEGAYSSPPLFYLLQTVPYGIASAGSLLDQLAAMRLLSALMGGLTALLVFLFVREALPAEPWAWTVGGLGVALMPLLGFMSGAMNPDAMLAAVSAAAFYCLARAFRGGLTRGLAIAIGVTMAVGFLTKLNFIGLAPGIAIGLIVLSLRAARTEGRRAAYLSLALALGIAASPLWLYVIVNLLSSHPGLGIVSGSLKLQSAHGSILSKLSYVWQLYLPRLPGMANDFPGLFTAHRLWFDRYVGFYGWLDTSFPLWVDAIALPLGGIIALLCARALVIGRSVLRARGAEILVYALMAFGLLMLIGLGSFFDKSSEGLGFAEPRYLLPLAALLGAGLALAARGAGRRWGPMVGAGILVLFFAHDLFSQLLVIARYYA
jgi:4-amino-4-deoxy-L-arabinose transferase-like glycosyltransferase